MRETETEREIVVNMDHMSMLEFGQFFIFIFNLPVFPFFCFALCEFIDYCKQAIPYLTGLDWAGRERV